MTWRIVGSVPVLILCTAGRVTWPLPAEKRRARPAPPVRRRRSSAPMRPSPGTSTGRSGRPLPWGGGSIGSVSRRSRSARGRKEPGRGCRRSPGPEAVHRPAYTGCGNGSPTIPICLARQYHRRKRKLSSNSPLALREGSPGSGCTSSGDRGLSEAIVRRPLSREVAPGQPEPGFRSRAGGI